MFQTSTAPYALVVDHDAVILEDASHILQDAGFRTLAAIDVEEAEALLVEYADAITVLFTDVDMPGSRNGSTWRGSVRIAGPTSPCWSRPAARALPDLPREAVFISKPFSKQVAHARLKEMLPDGAKPAPLKASRWRRPGWSRAALQSSRR